MPFGCMFFPVETGRRISDQILSNEMSFVARMELVPVPESRRRFREKRAAPEAYPIDIVHQDFTTARYYDGWTAGDVLVYDGIFADSLVELTDGLAYDKPGTEVLIVNSSATWSTEHRAQLRFEVDDVNGKPLPGVLCMDSSKGLSLHLFPTFL